MLVLSRKVGETVRIGPDILLMVVRVNGDHVRIGIEAPAQIPILRGELADGPTDQSDAGQLPYPQAPAYQAVT
jgi:carbon storage regulator